MRLRPIIEEWEDYVEVDYKNRNFSIYKNPDTNDFIKIKKEDGTSRVRYILNLYGKPEIHVFSSDLLHYFAAQKLSIDYKERVHLPVWGDHAFGESPIISGNKLELSGDVLKEIKNMGRHAPYEILNRYFINAPEKPQKKERKRLFRN